MEDQDLEKTKALTELSDLEEKNVYEEYDNLFREKKYSNIQQSLDAAKDLDNVDVDENGDIVEENSNEENTLEEVESLLEKEKKKNIFSRMKDSFKKMSKVKKFFVILLIILIIAGIGGILFVLLHDDKKNESSDNNEEEKDVIVIKDNYIYKNGNLVFLDKDDKEIGTYECTNKDEKLCYIAYQNNNEDTFYKTISMYEDESEIVSRINIYYDRYAFIYDNSSSSDGNVFLYDFKTNEKRDEYKAVKEYRVDNKDYIVVNNKNNVYQLYEMTELGLSLIGDKEYKYLGIMEDKDKDYVIAKLSTGYYLLDFSLENVSKLIGKNIVNYDDNYIVTSENGLYNLYTYDNEQKLAGYKFINLENSYISYVDADNNLFYLDKDLVKINEEGIKLNNDNYIPKKIYYNDGVLKEHIYSYQSNFTSEYITVAVRDDKLETDYFKRLDLNEFEYNKTITNYSYINGSLYFYADENKEKLIGSYTCKNKNESFKEGEILENCHPAIDTVYEDNDMTYDNGRNSMIPVFNEKYVFVYDGTVNSPSVVLYDLIEKKDISIYESVNTYTPNNKGVLSTMNVDSLNVICKNKSGNFGMINISKDTVSSVYDFKYNHMEMISGKTLALQDNKWKLLYGKTGSSAEFDGKIRGFIGNVSYFKTKKDGYSVYDAEGKKISKDGYKYIELYSNMYAAVDEDNKLMIYDYEGNEIIEDKIPLYSTVYYGNDSNAFMVAYSGNKIIVEVYKDGKYESVEKNIVDKTQQIPDDNTETNNNENNEENTENDIGE